LIQIESRWEEEGPQEVIAEDVVYDKLGLHKEDERASKLKQDACNASGPNASMNEFADDYVCEDQPDDSVGLCDWRIPVMSLGNRYKYMVTFPLAIRQYAINREFELGIEATSTTRFRDYCQGGSCPWKIHARVELIGSPTIIVCFFGTFQC
jgi:hypothetical protein